MATYVIETVGTQEYELGQQRFLRPVRRRPTAPAARPTWPRTCAAPAPEPTGARAGRATARRRTRSATPARRRPVRSCSASAPTSSRGPSRGLPQPAVPDAGRGQRGAARSGWWSPDPRGVLPLDGLRVSRSLRAACRRFEIRVDTAFDEVVAGCADKRGRAAGSARTSWRPTRGCTSWAGRTASRPGPSAGRAGPAGRRPVRRGARRAVRGGVDVPPRARRLQGGPGRARRAAHGGGGPDGPRLLDVQWATDHLVSLGAVEVARPTYLDLLAEALRCAAARIRRRAEGHLATGTKVVWSRVLTA